MCCHLHLVCVSICLLQANNSLAAFVRPSLFIHKSLLCTASRCITSHFHHGNIRFAFMRSRATVALCSRIGGMLHNPCYVTGLSWVPGQWPLPAEPQTFRGGAQPAQHCLLQVHTTPVASRDWGNFRQRLLMDFGRIINKHAVQFAYPTQVSKSACTFPVTATTEPCTEYSLFTECYRNSLTGVQVLLLLTTGWPFVACLMIALCSSPMHPSLTCDGVCTPSKCSMDSSCRIYLPATMPFELAIS